MKSLPAVALLLVACSDVGPDDSVPSNTQPSPQTGAITATDDPAPCPTADTDAGVPPRTGPQKTPSPVEHCEGAYDCWGKDYGEKWFSFDGRDCKFAGNVLTGDGRVIWLGRDVGHWEGDYTSFTMVTRPGEETGATTCTRRMKR
ncbi:MAG: hypothetical protein KF795_02380 [Labilithrix sp.]|nr:hypothetical protein [Labilithrix sp.]